MSEMTKMNMTDANQIEALTDISQPTQTSHVNMTDANQIQALVPRIHQRHTL